MNQQRKAISGKGGPIIIVQSSVIPQWKGAANFKNSLMMGGTVETDYDVICSCEHDVIERYNRDILVMDSCTFPAILFVASSGAIFAVQEYYRSDDNPEIIEEVSQMKPSHSFLIEVKDTALRLIVGADNGKGTQYGFQEVPVNPGNKRCNVYRSERFVAFVVNNV